MADKKLSYRVTYTRTDFRGKLIVKSKVTTNLAYTLFWINFRGFLLNGYYPINENN